MNDLKQRRLQTKLGHVFKDQQLFAQALTHRSVGNSNNERLEFLGDSLLSSFITSQLFQLFPSTKEGQLSRLRAQLVKGETLAALAREFELGDCLILGEGELKSGGHRRDSILADSLEALIGAIYLDTDYEHCRSCVLPWFESRLASLDLNTSSKDPKTKLQELLQGRGLALPNYELVQSKGQDHAQIFTVECRISLLPEPVIAEASNRRKAEKLAAAQVLRLLEERAAHE